MYFQSNSLVFLTEVLFLSAHKNIFVQRFDQCALDEGIKPIIKSVKWNAHWKNEILKGLELKLKQ